MSKFSTDVVQGGRASVHSDASFSEDPAETKKKANSFRPNHFFIQKAKELLPQAIMIFGGVVGGCALSYLARRAFPFLAAGRLLAPAMTVAINSLGGVAGGEVALAGLSLFLDDYASTWQRHKRGDEDVDTVEELVGAYAHQWGWSTFQSGAIGLAGRGVNIGAKGLVAAGGGKAIVGKGLQVIGSKLDWTKGQANTWAQVGHQIPREYVEEVGDEVASRIWKPLEYVVGGLRGGKVNVDTLGSYDYQVDKAQSGLHIQPENGSDLYRVAKQVFEDYGHGEMPNRRIVIDTQRWGTSPMITPKLKDQLKELAEEHNITICVKTANPSEPAIEIEPDSFIFIQQQRGKIAAAMDLTPRPGSLDPYNPYRYLRSVPDTPANVLQARQEWLAVLNEEELAQETNRSRHLPAEIKKAEALKRLDILEEDQYMGMTFACNFPDVFEFLSETFGTLPCTEEIAMASFGPGLIEFESKRYNWYNFALWQIARENGLAIDALSFEPIEILLRLLYEFPNASLDIYENNPKTKETLERRPLPFMMPFFADMGIPYTHYMINYAVVLARRLRVNPNQYTFRLSPYNRLYNLLPDVTPHPSHQVIYGEVPEAQLQKMNIHLLDIGTEVFEGYHKLRAAFYLQTAYFMDPLLQRAALIKIINQLEDNGYLVSGFILTDAEAKALGLKIVRKIDAKSSLDPNNPYYVEHERDRFVFIYQKQEVTETVSELMGRIRNVQSLP